MDKKTTIIVNGELYHGGPGSGRWKAGSTGNTPGSREALLNAYKSKNRKPSKDEILSKKKKKEDDDDFDQGGKSSNSTNNNKPKFDKQQAENDRKNLELTEKLKREKEESDAKIQRDKKESNAKIKREKNESDSKVNKTNQETENLKSENDRKNKESEKNREKTQAEIDNKNVSTDILKANKDRQKRDDDEKQRVYGIDKQSKALGTGAQMAGTVSNALRKDSALYNANKYAASERNKKLMEQEMASMDNKQLRERVERLELEKRYKNVNADRMDKGAQFAEKALVAGSTIAAVGSTALTIASLFKDLEKFKD